MPETERIRELRNFAILDTRPHPAFDGISRLAASVCAAPVAFISFIDEHRQWIKSKVGIEISETSREEAICRYTILSDEVLVIHDVKNDERMRSNPLVQRAGIRFYAGVPLTTESGSRIGTLCVLDYAARDLSQEQAELLRILSEQVMAQLKLHAQRKLLMENSRMAALGEMAAEVAHEINNPLAIIRARVSMMKRDLDEAKGDAPMAIAHLSKIDEVVVRISKIVSGLSSYAREDQPTDPATSVLIRELVENTISFCRDKFEANHVLLKIIVPSDPVRMICHPVQISQVLLNLLNNAFDAVNVGTHLIKEVCLEATYAGEKIFFIVSDNGPGVPEKIRNKLFNPFFTTKPAGKGTGLGLSLSKTIIALHKGTIELDQTTQVGARFIIKLPQTGPPNCVRAE